jgi:hypothetical protein
MWVYCSFFTNTHPHPHLKARRVEVNIPSTVVIDISSLSEPIRIIGIYWPVSQQRDLDDLQSYLVEGTIITGYFNATVKQWNSSLTDRRGLRVKEWIEENNLEYISSTAHTSTRSLRNIDLSFSNMTAISSETLQCATRDQWVMVL